MSVKSTLPGVPCLNSRFNEFAYSCLMSVLFSLKVQYIKNTCDSHTLFQVSESQVTHYRKVWLKPSFVLDLGTTLNHFTMLASLFKTLSFALTFFKMLMAKINTAITTAVPPTGIIIKNAS